MTEKMVDDFHRSVKAVISEDLNDVFSTNSAAEEYTLNKRVSAPELIKIFETTLKNGTAYLSTKIQEAKLLIQKNLGTTLKLDCILGTTVYENEESEKIVSQKDKSIRLKCPACPVKTFKLRRHIAAKHREISDIDCDFLVSFSKITALNSDKAAFPSEKKVKKPVNSHTSLVSKRYNLKKCCVCKKLVMNLPFHLQNAHKLKKGSEDYIDKLNCEVIPKCYTKKVNGYFIELQGEEMKTAIESNGELIDKQQEILGKLRKLRDDVKTAGEELKSAELDEETVKKKQEKLVNMKKNYFDFRYSDKKVMSDNVKIWRSSYLKHMELRGVDNPRRCCNMAFEVLLPYEKVKGSPLKFTDLNPINVRKMLRNFRENVMMDTSKMKYIKEYEKLLHYLYIDIESPARQGESADESLKVGLHFRTIENEICTTLKLLSKNRGRELVQTKKRAKKKLMSDCHLQEILAKISNETLELTEKTEADLENYSDEEATSIRNNLIAIAILRLGRRVKEIIEMTLEEVNNHEEKTIDGEKYVIIHVLEQKNVQSGEEAPILYTANEFEALLKYIKILRPKLLGNNKDVVNVFINGWKNSKRPVMSFSTVNHILQHYETLGGKKLGSRAIRGSKATNIRNMDLTHQQKTDFAKSMSHSLLTAERYYNYAEISNSVAKTVTLEKRKRAGNESVDTTASDLDQSFSVNMIETNICTSTPVKINNTSKSTNELNETIKQLRSKKIKRNDLLNEKKEQLSQIKELIKNMFKTIPVEDKINKSGAASIASVKRKLPKAVLKLFTTQEIKNIVSEVSVRD